MRLDEGKAFIKDYALIISYVNKNKNGFGQLIIDILA